MLFNQYYFECLSHASYLIGDETTGRAVVIDPQRDVVGVPRRRRRGGDDDRTGHRDPLPRRLPVRSSRARRGDRRQDRLLVGRPARVRDHRASTTVSGTRSATTARTPSRSSSATRRGTRPSRCRSSSTSMRTTSIGRRPSASLTGDTLFIGDVGRPDLLSSIGFTRDELADQLYDSLHGQLMTLPDATAVYPAHGAGSACGKNLSTELSSTIGEQKADQLCAASRRQGDVHGSSSPRASRRRPATSSTTRSSTARTASSSTRRKCPTAMIVRRRARRARCGARCSSTVAPPRSSPKATSAGDQRRPRRPLCRVRRLGDPVRRRHRAHSSMPGFELEGKNRLARIGFDRVIGYLEQPYKVMFQHRDDVQVASRLTAKAFDERRRSMDDLQVVDIRNPGEVSAGKIDDAIEIPVGQLPDRFDELDVTKADRRLLRRRLPLLGRREPAPTEGLRRRERHHRWLRRLDRVGADRLRCCAKANGGSRVTRLGFALLSDSCIGCHACTVACKSEHDVPLGRESDVGEVHRDRRVPEHRPVVLGDALQPVRRRTVHDDLPDAARCSGPTTASSTSRTIDCIGCKSCMNACPYDAIVHQPRDQHRAQVQLLQPPCRGRPRTVVRDRVPDGGDRDRRPRRPDSEVSKIIARDEVAGAGARAGHEPEGLLPRRRPGVARPDPHDDQRRRDDLGRHDARSLDASPPTMASPLAAPAWWRGPPTRPPTHLTWKSKVSGYLVTKAIAAGLMLLAALLVVMGHGIRSGRRRRRTPDRGRRVHGDHRRAAGHRPQAARRGSSTS